MGSPSEALIWPLHLAVVHELRCLSRSFIALNKPVPPELPKALAAIEATPGPRRDLVAAATVLRLPLWSGTPARSVAMRIVHQQAPFPAAALELRARVVLGESPAELSGGLPSKDAHAWLESGSLDTPLRFYLERHGLPHARVHSVQVAIWLVARWQKKDQREALVRRRSERGPRGETIDGAWIGRVDELRIPDLRPSVRDTFARAAVRLHKRAQREALKDQQPLATAPSWWRPARCARLLLTAHELAVEGAEMRHCVGSYTSEVRRKECVIVALNVRGHRSTVELARLTGIIQQHKGLGNTAPHELCTRALSVLHRRWGKALLEEVGRKFDAEFAAQTQGWRTVERDGGIALERVR